MSVLVTRQAPDFTAPAVNPSGCIEDFTLSSLRGKYVVLFLAPGLHFCLPDRDHSP